MGDGVGVDFFCYLDQMFGDQWLSNRGIKQIMFFVECVGLKYWKDKIMNEFFMNVDNMDFFNVKFFGFFVYWF